MSRSKRRIGAQAQINAAYSALIVNNVPEGAAPSTHLVMVLAPMLIKQNWPRDSAAAATTTAADVALQALPGSASAPTPTITTIQTILPQFHPSDPCLIPPLFSLPPAATVCPPLLALTIDLAPPFTAEMDMILVSRTNSGLDFAGLWE